MRLVGSLSCVLNLRDQCDCLFFVLVTLVVRLVFVNMKKLPITQILLHDDACIAINRINLRYRNLAIEKQARYVEIWMEFGIERLGIDRSYRGALLPANPVIL